MLLFCMMLVLWEDGQHSDWVIDDLDIYQPIRYEFFQVGADGIYIHDHQGIQILHYGLDGKALEAIGREGTGPGEFGRAFYSQYFEGKLYAGSFMSQKMWVFSPDGRFEKGIELPYRGIFQKIKDGWVWLKLAGMRDESTDTVLYHFKEGFEDDREEVVRFEFKFEGGFRRENGKMVVSINPSPEFPRLAVSADGKTGYLYKGSGLAQISKLDLTKGVVTNEFTYPAKKIPFDPEWGEKRFKERSSGASSFGYERDFPEYFAMVNDLRVGPHGNVWIMPGNRDDLVFRSTICLSPDGQKIDPPFDPQLMKHLVGFYDDYAYFCEFDEDGDDSARITRRPLSALK